MKEAIQRNMGIGILYEDVARYNLKRGEFKALRIRGLKLEAQSHIISLNDKPLSKTATDFLNLLRSSQFNKQMNGNNLSTERNSRHLATPVRQIRGDKESGGFFG